ncbi:hypothetical protein [Undibacterium sp. TJN19]|uniref:hypothetical protein n=1 Tax=Undibacterium sp. TJN19 TaxID=3413055 RepID=UPI003BF43512
MGTRLASLGRYLLSIGLTVTVFGLGYFCGNRAEKSAHFNVGASGMNVTSSRASARPDALRQHRNSRKAALLV